ncbi:hypothetical protein THAOC_34810, partial [Thalassiosira oceanica]
GRRGPGEVLVPLLRGGLPDDEDRGGRVGVLEPGRPDGRHVQQQPEQRLLQGRASPPQRLRGHAGRDRQAAAQDEEEGKDGPVRVRAGIPRGERRRRGPREAARHVRRGVQEAAGDRQHQERQAAPLCRVREEEGKVPRQSRRQGEQEAAETFRHGQKVRPPLDGERKDTTRRHGLLRPHRGRVRGTARAARRPPPDVLVHVRGRRGGRPDGRAAPAPEPRRAVRPASRAVRRGGGRRGTPGPEHPGERVGVRPRPAGERGEPRGRRPAPELGAPRFVPARQGARVEDTAGPRGGGQREPGPVLPVPGEYVTPDDVDAVAILDRPMPGLEVEAPDAPPQEETPAPSGTLTLPPRALGTAPAEKMATAVRLEKPIGSQLVALPRAPDKIDAAAVGAGASSGPKLTTDGVPSDYGKWWLSSDPRAYSPNPSEPLPDGDVFKGLLEKYWKPNKPPSGRVGKSVMRAALNKEKKRRQRMMAKAFHDYRRALPQDAPRACAPAIGKADETAPVESQDSSAVYPPARAPPQDAPISVPGARGHIASSPADEVDTRHCDTKAWSAA